MRAVAEYLAPVVNRLMGECTVGRVVTGRLPRRPLQRQAARGDFLYQPRAWERDALRVSRCDVPFTETEVAVAWELFAAAEYFFNLVGPRRHDPQYRTALLTSVGDIAVARHLGGRNPKIMWPVQRLIQLLKALSHQRYEATPATSGFLVGACETEGLRRAAESHDMEWVSVDPPQHIHHRLFESPMNYRLVDGTEALYAVSHGTGIAGLVLTHMTERLSSVDVLSHRLLFPLLGEAGPGAFVMLSNGASEVEALFSKEKILVWRRGYWSLFDPEVFRWFLRGSIAEGPMEDLIWTVYALSKDRHGAVILIADLSGEDLRRLRIGSVAGTDPLSAVLAAHVRGRSVSTLKASGELLGLLTSDGLTVLDSRGAVLDTGVICDTSRAGGEVTGGGRTTAAYAASRFGKVIKVSQDGPIELYEGGEHLYRFG